MRLTRIVGRLVVIVLVAASTAYAQVDRGTNQPRVDLGVGLAGVRIRELPPREHVGQGALSLFASGGLFWTPYLLTQVDVTSQVERFGWSERPMWCRGVFHLRLAREVIISLVFHK